MKLSILQKTGPVIKKIVARIRLKPLSLAEKCRLQFGAAVVFSLILALLIPYIWMGQLTRKIALDSGRAVAETVFERHFQLGTEQNLPPLNETGSEKKNGISNTQWIDLSPENDKQISLDQKHSQVLEMLLEDDEHRKDFAWISHDNGQTINNYMQLVKAENSCINCHNPQFPAQPFNKNQNVGAIIVTTHARDISKTQALNKLWIVVAGLLAGIGAMVSFYAIAQRIILRPIRQLRALVNNIAEGNLDARSKIKSGDEYERLSDAFNDMLDGLQESQEKLRQANIQLDAKIAQLSERNIELFKANKLKSEFLANMSHEFRTPLNAILGFAELLKEKPDHEPEKSRRYASNIATSGRNLLNMINDLLDLAKAEAGKMQLRVEKVDLKELCSSLVAFFSPLSDEKKINVRLSAVDEIPSISTDPGKVQQILYNLLSNAIKFTPEQGTIQINVKMLDDKTVRIAVADTGPGITAEHQKGIFEKFRQVDGSITRHGSGTGLGLAICKELSNLLAANISLQSEQAKGSTFYLDLPISLPEAKQQNPQNPEKTQ